MTDPGLVRAVALLVPSLLSVVAWLSVAPPPRRRAGVLLARAWPLAALVGLQLVNQRAGWWSYEATGGLFLAMPVDLLLGWVLLWGIAAPLLAAQIPLWMVAALAAAFDLAVMPLCAPVVRLAPHWRSGEL